MAELWTLIIRGPHRAPVGFERAHASAEKATVKPHHIHVHDNRAKNIGIGPAQHRSQLMALEDPEMRYWAKLDDDATVPPGCWDDLVFCLDEARKAGFRAAAAMACPPGLTPLFLVKDGRTVRPKRGPAIRRAKSGQCIWRVCGMVGSGASVYTREVLEAGCVADPGFFSAGVDLDVAWHMQSLGYVSLLCDPPASQHFPKQVNSHEYEMIRRAAEHRSSAATYFAKKWGLEVCFA